MKIDTFNRRRAGTLLLGTLAVAALPAWAQDKYPSKSIRLVVPFSAGGAVDTVGRSLGERLAAQVGQAVIPASRPPCGGRCSRPRARRCRWSRA